MKFLAMPILRRFGFRNVLQVNTVLAAIFVALPAFFSPQTPIVVIVTLLLIGGFFRSLQFTSVNSLAFADISQERMSAAATLTSVAALPRPLHAQRVRPSNSDRDIYTSFSLSQYRVGSKKKDTRNWSAG